MMIEPAIRRLPRRWLAPALVLLCASCGNDAPSAPQFQDPKKLIWALVLDHHAITLAATGPQSSIQLSPVAVNSDGETLAGASIAYSLSDSQVVSVDANGLVTARQSAVGVELIASTQVNNVTKKDTAYVNIVDVSPAPVLDAFTVSLASGATTLPAGDAFGFFGNDLAVGDAADADGNPMYGLPVHFTSSDPTTLTVDAATGVVHAIRPGEVTITGTTTAFGVTKTSTITVTVGPPALGSVLAIPVTPFGSTTQMLVFEPGDLTVSVGAQVFFANPSNSLPIDVVFDDSTDVAESPFFPSGSGNIEPFFTDTINGGFGFRFRFFPKPGTYTYHSTLFPTNGRIIVE